MTNTVRRVLSVAICTPAIALLATAAARPRDAERPSEIARIQTHFDSVLHELRAVDVTLLTTQQRSARAELIRRLEQYSAAGRFPHNHVRPGEYVPVFRDEHRTLCAMAYLIASTGRTDIVDRVASTNNLAYIPELARNAALRVWLDSVGLTVAEAARVQPAYGGEIIVPDQMAAKLRDQRRDYAWASAGVTPFSSASLYVNLAARHSSASSHVVRWGGILAGAAQLVYGVTGLDDSDQRRTMGAANIAVGGGAVASALWRMHRRPSTTASRAASVHVQPLVTSGGAGLLFSARM